MRIRPGEETPSEGPRTDARPDRAARAALTASSGSDLAARAASMPDKLFLDHPAVAASEGKIVNRCIAPHTGLRVR